MRFIETRLNGAYLIEFEPVEDERGWFTRTFCREEFKKQGLSFTVVQCSLSYNKKRGTLRGMHYQIPPHEEAKLIRCIKGRLYDVIIDVRPGSPTCGQWIAEELSAERFTQLYIPEGFAHGFQTLEDDTIVFYQMSEFYSAECALGVRWDDPAIGIQWPEDERIISAKDRSYPLVNPNFAVGNYCLMPRL